MSPRVNDTARALLRALAIAALVVAGGLLSAPYGAGVAHAERETDLDVARDHYQAGRALFEEGRYRDALAEFARADAVVSSPMNRYNIALCHERLGNDQAAISEYRAYLRALPDADNRRDVEARISALESARGTEPSRDAGDHRRGPAEDGPQPGQPADRGEDLATDPAADRDFDGDWDRGAERGSERARPDEEAENASGAYPPGSEPRPHPDQDGELAADDSPDDDDSRFYHSWWFWGVAGLSAIILINFATASPGDSASLEMRDPDLQGGATLFRF